jgi:hypothetical protein
MFVVEDEKARFALGEGGHDRGTAGQIVLPASTPHEFVSRGSGRLQQIDLRPVPC